MSTRALRMRALRMLNNMFGVHLNITRSGSRLEATICLAVAVLVDQIDEYDLFRLDNSHCGCVRARAWDRGRVSAESYG